MSCTWPSGCTQPAGETGFCTRHWGWLYKTGRRHRTFVTPHAVLAHVNRYLARGGSLRALAKRAGVDHTSLVRLVNGHHARIATQRAARILAVPLRPSDVGCMRRLDALSYLGWPIPTIADRVGVGVHVLCKARQRGRFSDTAAWATHRAYEQLTNWGPSRSIATQARSKGKLPPWVWADLDIDDPDAYPDLILTAQGPRPVQGPSWISAASGPTKDIEVRNAA